MVSEEQRRQRVAYRLRVEACKLRREELLRFREWFNENESFNLIREGVVDEYIADEFFVSTEEMGVEA